MVQFTHVFDVKLSPDFINWTVYRMDYNDIGKGNN